MDSSYEALGLVASLTPTTSGGLEKSTNALASDRWRYEGDVSMEPQAQASSYSSSSKGTHGSVPKGYGRIVRDEAGNIVDVQLAEEEDSTGPMVPPRATIEELPDFTQDEQLAPWVGLGSMPGSRRTDTSETHVVQGMWPFPHLNHAV